MTTDPLNFRDLAFRLSRRPPIPSYPPPEPLLRPRSGHRERLTGVLGGRVAASEPSSVPRDPLARPLRSGPTFSRCFHFPQARRPGRDHRASLHGAGLGTNSELSACRSWRERDGDLPARPSSGQGEEDRGRDATPLQAKPPGAWGSRHPQTVPTRTHRHAFAHAGAHTCTHLHTRARTSAHRHSRACSRPYTLRVVTKEEGPALPYFSFSSPLFCSPPALRGRARPAPALRAPRRRRAAAFQSSASERQLRAQAPAPRSRAGGRQKLRRRRRPRGQGVLANCQEMCVCAPGAGGPGGGGRREGESRRGDPPPQPRHSPAPGTRTRIRE